MPILNDKVMDGKGQSPFDPEHRHTAVLVGEYQASQTVLKTCLFQQPLWGKWGVIVFQRKGQREPGASEGGVRGRTRKPRHWPLLKLSPKGRKEIRMGRY